MGLQRAPLAQETNADGKLANIAQLTLTIATENARPMPHEKLILSLNRDRFRLATKTPAGERLQVCDGQTCWSYTSVKNEYMTGRMLRDVSTSVGGSMAMFFHFFPFLMLEHGTVQEAKVAREEEVEVGKERRKCHVIEGVIRPTPPPRDSKKPPAAPTFGVDMLLSMLRLQGLADEGRREL